MKVYESKICIGSWNILKIIILLMVLFLLHLRFECKYKIWLDLPFLLHLTSGHNLLFRFITLQPIILLLLALILSKESWKHLFHWVIGKFFHNLHMWCNDRVCIHFFQENPIWSVYCNQLTVGLNLILPLPSLSIFFSFQLFNAQPLGLHLLRSILSYSYAFSQHIWSLKARLWYHICAFSVLQA